MQKDDYFFLRILLVVAVIMVIASQCLLLIQPAGIVVQLSSLSGFFGSEGIIVIAASFLGLSWQRVIVEKFAFERIRNFATPLVWTLFTYVLAWCVSVGTQMISRSVIASDLAYLLFMQNFAWPMSSSFQESWLVPVIFFGFIAYALMTILVTCLKPGLDADNTSIISSACLIALSLLVKMCFLSHTAKTLEFWDTHVRSVTLWRLDSVWIVIGIAAATKNLTRKVALSLAICGLAGIAFFSLGVGYLGFTIERAPVFWNVFYLPAISVALALLLPAAIDIVKIFPKPIWQLCVCAYLCYYSTSLLISAIEFRSTMVNLVIYLLTTGIFATIIWVLSTAFHRNSTLRKRFR